MHTTVYVHSTKGNMGEKCGTYRYDACKSLRTAIEKTAKGGTVHLIGEHVITSTIPLWRDITITTSKQDKGIIIGKSKSNTIHAFVIKRSGLKLKLSGILFLYIGVLYTSLASNIIVENVHVTSTHTKIDVIHAEYVNIRKSERIKMRKELKKKMRKESKKRSESFLSISVSSSTFTNTWRAVYVNGGTAKPKSIVSISDTKFSNTSGIKVERMQGNLSIYKCLFHENRVSMVKIIHVNTVNISSSVFANNTMILRGFLFMVNVKNVIVSRCSFYNGSTTTVSGAGCVSIRGATKSLVEHCTFTKCYARMSGGALLFESQRGNSTLRKNLFKENTALTMGGAVFISNIGGQYRVESKLYFTTMEFCLFVNNEARVEGQAVRSSLNLNMRNVMIFARQKRSVPHLNLYGEFIKVGDIKIVTTNGKIIENGLNFHGAMISADDLQVIGNIYYMCPKHFNMISYKVRHKHLRKKIRILSLFVARCKSCPSNQYTLTTGMLKVLRKDVKQITTPKVCLACPNGARCDGNVIPLDNYWGYRASQSKSFLRNVQVDTAVPLMARAASITTRARKVEPEFFVVRAMLVSPRVSFQMAA